MSEFTILNVPGSQIVGRLSDDVSFIPPVKNWNVKSLSDQVFVHLPKAFDTVSHSVLLIE